MSDVSITALIDSARSAAKRADYYRTGEAGLFTALADALEAAERDAQQAEDQANSLAGDVAQLEQQLAALQAVIADARERLEHVMHPDTTRCYLCVAENALTQSPTGALEAHDREVAAKALTDAAERFKHGAFTFVGTSRQYSQEWLRREAASIEGEKP